MWMKHSERGIISVLHDYHNCSVIILCVAEKCNTMSCYGAVKSTINAILSYIVGLRECKTNVGPYCNARVQMNKQMK